ncbi:hypothetical protein [Uliginosibacterium sediminicola]|uniref:DUF4124 domain-containing protein n=1 Tax=Uliginosibacterium sediminicola TaxID=2024550 RepID=A0ABU9YVQ0_9RHOO
MRKLILLVVLVCLLLAAWPHRHRLLATVKQQSLPAFNSLQRELALPSAAQAEAKTVLHKCVHASEVTYTDAACPAGATRQAVAGDRVSVVPAAEIPPAAAQSSAATPLHQALELDKNTQLGEQIIDRAVAGGAK